MKTSSVFSQSSSCFITGWPGAPPLDLHQRRHDRVEDRIRAAKARGLRNFPFECFVPQRTWLAMVMIA
ncbi:MAG: hypothetical protein LC713_02630 [Actinobacteria bacterium]|nr:hypothetical protein [Actinomycetota bacterium]